MDRIMLDTCCPILTLELGFKTTMEKRMMQLPIAVGSDHQSPNLA